MQKGSKSFLNSCFLMVVLDMWLFSSFCFQTVSQPGDNISLNISAVDEYNTTMSSISILSYASFYDNGTLSPDPDIMSDDVAMFVKQSKWENSDFSYKVSSQCSYQKLIGKNRDKISSVSFIHILFYFILFLY